MDSPVIVVEGGIFAIKESPPPEPPPPTHRQEFQLVLKLHRDDLATAEATIAWTTGMLSSMPDRADPRQRRRDDANSELIARDMRRTMNDSARFGTWWFAHLATKNARDKYRDAIAKFDKAVREAAKIIRRFLANPTSKMPYLRDWILAEAAKEASRKELNSLIFEEQEAARGGYVDCTEDMAEVCVQKNHFKCVTVDCEYDDCICTFTYRSGDQWDPKKQRELREKGKKKDGKDGDKKGGGGRGGHADAAGPAAGPAAPVKYAEGSQGAPEVPKKPASTAPPPRRRPPEQRPEGTTPQGPSACRTCADSLALVAAMGQTSNPAGMEQQIECLWTAASNTTAVGGGLLTDGLDRNAPDRTKLVTELAARCSSQVSRDRAGGTQSPAGSSYCCAPQDEGGPAAPPGGPAEEDKKAKKGEEEKANDEPNAKQLTKKQLTKKEKDEKRRKELAQKLSPERLARYRREAVTIINRTRHHRAGSAKRPSRKEVSKSWEEADVHYMVDVVDADGNPTGEFVLESRKGMTTNDPARGIEEILAAGRDDDERFAFDCASVAVIIEYAALLQALGRDDFNSLFGGRLVILGSVSSGTPGYSYVEGFDATPLDPKKPVTSHVAPSAPLLWVDTDEGYQAGDIVYLKAVNGANVTMLEDGGPAGKDAFSHGDDWNPNAEDPWPTGVRKFEEYEYYWGKETGRIRPNTDDVIDILSKSRK